MNAISNTEKTDPLRPLSLDDINSVAGGLKPLVATQGGAQCFPIFEDDGHGGIIIISPTLGPLGRFPR